MRDKTVLITGAGGFIGSHLTEAVVKTAGKVKAFVHYNSRNDCGLLKEVNTNVLDGVELIFSDIRDEMAVYNAMKGVDVVFHLAALIGIPYSYQAPNSYVDTNIHGTLNVLNAARLLETSKIVHTSTSEVYGTALFTPINENHPLQAQSPYAATKIAADKLAESYYLSFNLPVATIRPFNTYGPRQSLRAVIPTIICQALSEKVVMLGNTNTVRDFNYVKDTVQGFIKIAECEHSTGKVINVGTGEGTSINQVVEVVAGLLGDEITIQHDQGRLRPEQSEVHKLICDSTIARDVAGWQPAHSFEAGIAETIEYYRNKIQVWKTCLNSYVI